MGLKNGFLTLKYPKHVLIKIELQKNYNQGKVDKNQETDNVRAIMIN